MADSAVAITAGAGTNVDTRTEATNGDHRQVIVIGDPSVTAGVAPVSATNGLTTTTPDLSATISIAANATSSGQVTGLTGAGKAAIQLTGAWSASVQVQITVDGTNWSNITQNLINVVSGGQVSNSLGANGIYWADVLGMTGVRVITTAYTSGTVTGTVRVVPSTMPTQLALNTAVSVGGYPTAVASADAFANPTVTQIGATELRFNGTTWDRARNVWNTTTTDTGTKTTSFTGATVTNYDARGAYITVLCGTVSGTTPTLTAQLQWSPDVGTTWLNLGPATTAITATGNTALIAIYPANLSQAAGGTPATLTTGATTTTAINAPLPRTWRLNYTLGGTTPSFAITAVYVNYIN
jgi:hypothetical protein